MKLINTAIQDQKRNVARASTEKSTICQKRILRALQQAKKNIERIKWLRKEITWLPVNKAIDQDIREWQDPDAYRAKINQGED